MNVLCICVCISRLSSPSTRNSVGDVFIAHRPDCQFSLGGTFCAPRLKEHVYKLYKSLGILKRQPTRRGRRKSKSCRHLTALCLINACSLNKRYTDVSAHLVHYKLDLLAITETWQHDNDDSGLRRACPDGFSFVHTPRQHSVGGGVALIFKSTICVQKSQVLFVSTSFESLDLHVRIRHRLFRLIVLYRPPCSAKSPPFSVFLSEFSIFLEFSMDRLMISLSRAILTFMSVRMNRLLLTLRPWLILLASFNLSRTQPDVVERVGGILLTWSWLESRVP